MYNVHFQFISYTSCFPLYFDLLVAVRRNPCNLSGCIVCAPHAIAFINNASGMLFLYWQGLSNITNVKSSNFTSIRCCEMHLLAAGEQCQAFNRRCLRAHHPHTGWLAQTNDNDIWIWSSSSSSAPLHWNCIFHTPNSPIQQLNDEIEIQKQQPATDYCFVCVCFVCRIKYQYICRNC